MQRWSASLVLVGVVGFGFVSVASAQVQIQVQVQAQPVLPNGRIMQPIRYQPASRLIEAEAIFAGRVVAMEPMDIDAEPAKGQAKVAYRIATVEVAETLHGLKKETKMVRVAFLVNANNGVGGGAGGFNGNIAPNGIQPGFARPNLRPYIPQLTLQVGQEGIFAVNKHFKENFYLAPSAQNFVNRENNPNFDADLKSAKRLANVIGNPAAALKAEDKDDRYLAAAILLTKYRANPQGVAMKGEPIDAAESKLILQALAGGDWANPRFNAIVPSPFELFQLLGVNAVPNNAQGMQKWLDQNAGKHVIQKLVADPNGKVGQPQPAVIRQPLRQPPQVQIQPVPNQK